MTRMFVILMIMFGAITFCTVWGFIVYAKGSRRAAVFAGLAAAVVMMAFDIYTHFHPHTR